LTISQSAGVNNGVIRAHRCGIVTSTSLMVRHDAAKEAIELSRTCPALSVGLHLDLGECLTGVAADVTSSAGDKDVQAHRGLPTVKCDCAGLLRHAQVCLRRKECEGGKDVTHPA